MTPTKAAVPAAASAWTCPFCPLACDHLRVRERAGALMLVGGECVRASHGLASFNSVPASTASAQIDGIACDLDAATAEAAALLAASHQPLFAGLATDVAGARALYPLACATGAICDSAAGEATTARLRALQDRGQFTTTLAEVRTRADVIVFIGGAPVDIAPLIGERCGIGDGQVEHRRVVVLGGSSQDATRLAAWAARGGVRVDTLPLEGDLFDTLALLTALVSPRPMPAASEPLRALATQLRDAKYAVLVGTTAHGPAHAALLVETVHRIVGHLNRTTRAAALWVDGRPGAATVQQVFTWLSGLPLRSRLGPRGLEHEPWLYDAARLVAEGAVDAVLWVSSFDADDKPPPSELPMIVLGHPALAAAMGRRKAKTVFIPVATPGIGYEGHVFRTDGQVLMPLSAVRRDALPTVAEVVARIASALHASRSKVTA
jgi:formylmethanofuran dehydrogenase subunit B